MKLKAEIKLSKEFDGLKIKILGLTKVYDDIFQEIWWGAQDIRNTILRSMYDTPKTGHSYRRGKKPNVKFHIASSPGHPPAVDSGELAKSITAEARRDAIEVGAEIGAPYAKFLEEGTPKMKKRPFLKPAKDKHLPEIKASIKRIILDRL